MKSQRSIFIPIAWAMWFVTALTAQTPPDQNQVPLIKTTTRTVVVDVVVTKSNGDPVPGLQKQDFELVEDGKPQTINFFEEHAAKTLPAKEVKTPAALPPNVYSNIPPAPESDSVNVLLIDTLNTEVADQPFVRTQVLKFLKQMHPGTRVAIFSLGSQFRFVQGFTSDVSLLQSALNNKKNGPKTEKNASFHSRSDENWDGWERGIMASLAAQLGGGAGVLVEGTAAAQAEAAGVQYKQRVSMTLAALETIARYLAGVPGRKNLIWFASSFPVTVFPTSSERQRMTDMHLNVNQARETADLLFTSKVAVYPVSAEGMMNNYSADAEHCLPEPGNSCPDAGVGPAQMNNIKTESDSRADTQMAMEKLANDTGGEAFYNTNDLNKAMQQAITDGSHYYTLAYKPTDGHMDGEFRKIKVQLTKGNYRLAYRRGYNATASPTAAAATAGDPLRPLLARGLPSTTELLYGVRTVPVSPQPAPNATPTGLSPKLTGPLTRYGVEFLIPWTDVSFHVAQDGNRSGKITFGAIAYDSDGNVVSGRGKTQGMELTPANFAAIQKAGVPAYLEIDLPDKDVYLETGIYDWTTNKAGTLGIPLHPGSEASTAAPTGSAVGKVQ